MKTEYLTFFKDKRFYIPLLILICFDLLLQTGLYKPFLKKNSYAANVNRITDHVLDMQKKHDPDILILGTSVAYQGLSPRILQEKINPYGLKIQSIAVPGSELIVQELVSKKILKEFKNVKLLIYVGEITMPWVAQYELGLPTLAMVGEFSVIDSLTLPEKHKYRVKFEDLFFLTFKSVAYRRDFRDLLLDPGKRMKHFGRALRNPNLNFYDFENNHDERMSSYNISTLQNCIEYTKDWNSPPFPENSNPDHKKAVLDTCALSAETNPPLHETPETKLYFERLGRVYSHYKERNIRVINIFAPYSHIMAHLGDPKRLTLWEDNLKKILGDSNVTSVDFQNIFKDEDSNKYCYDTIHLNRPGMERFSEAFGNYLIENLEELFPGVKKQ
ncbi:MAG: SGNH/GDSL hydrolase family protein [Leptospiraceae bacterium]|nr:SGNH/GDSL hydrolase family protein [Leptospiraceae bacterium]